MTRTSRWAGTAVAAALATAVVIGAETGAGTHELTRPYKGGGLVSMELAAGQYEIQGTADSRITMRWSTKDAADLGKVTVNAKVDGANAYIDTDNGPSNGFHVEVSLPSRCNLRVRLSAGDLTVSGVQGNTDLSAWAGKMTVRVADPSAYRSLDASVTAGEIRAEPFKLWKSGLFRSVAWQGSGQYDVRVRLTAGDLVFERGDAAH